MDRIKNIGKSKKFGRTLREQNAKRYGIDNKTLKGLESFYCRTDTDKFTIVELLFRGRRYHGLSAKSDHDMSNLTEGIAHAYSRAFDNMIYDVVLDIQPGKIRIHETFRTKYFKSINLSQKPISVDGITEMECQHCQTTSQYISRNISHKTKCPMCGKRLSEPALPIKFSGGSN